MNVVKRILLVFLFINSCFVADAQVSRPEICWAVSHPFIACKAFRITKFARLQADQMKSSNQLDRDGSGGQVDAFRHSYWMALLSQKIKPAKALKLGIAHEKGNYLDFRKGRMEDGELPDKISSAMDLYNNEKGCKAGSANRELPADSLKILIIDLVKKGEMKIIYKDSSGHFLRCDDSIIDMNEYRGQWEVPKCLVKSSAR